MSAKVVLRYFGGLLIWKLKVLFALCIEEVASISLAVELKSFSVSSVCSGTSNNE